jgi:hypothetical protein
LLMAGSLQISVSDWFGRYSVFERSGYRFA